MTNVHGAFGACAVDGLTDHVLDARNGGGGEEGVEMV